MASDLRVPMAPIIGAFGLPITVTRPAPDDVPIGTDGVWMPPPLEEPRPVGTDFQRREPRKALAVVRTTALNHIPRGSIILAAEQKGGTVKTWRVDGYEAPGVESDLLRVILVLA